MTEAKELEHANLSNDSLVQNRLHFMGSGDADNLLEHIWNELEEKALDEIGHCVNGLVDKAITEATSGADTLTQWAYEAVVVQLGEAAERQIVDAAHQIFRRQRTQLAGELYRVIFSEFPAHLTEHRNMLIKHKQKTAPSQETAASP